MKKLLTCMAVGLLILSCNEDPKVQPKDEFKQKITEQEQRVKELSMNVKNAQDTDSAKVELVSVLLDYYREFPKDEYSANCLSKVHMIYSGIGNVNMAVAYADTLITKYPKFIDRSQMIESQIINYEMSITPRDTDKIKMYLELWLKENKDGDKEKISEMKYHLLHVETPLLERLDLNLDELN